MAGTQRGGQGMSGRRMCGVVGRGDCPAGPQAQRASAAGAGLGPLDFYGSRGTVPSHHPRHADSQRPPLAHADSQFASTRSTVTPALAAPTSAVGSAGRLWGAAPGDQGAAGRFHALAGPCCRGPQ